MKKVYGHDCKSAPEKAAWKDALSALQKEDFYGLVMVDAAGIPRSEAIPPQAIPLFDKRLIVFGVTVAAVIRIAILLIFDPFHSNWIRPGWPRLVLIPVFLGILWWLGARQKRIALGEPPSR